jgi:nucleoside-diphosphate-sugar epimerase
LPPYYFGAYLDLHSLTTRPDRARSELGLELTPLEDGFRDAYRWYRQQERAKPDYSWEDKTFVALGR